MRWKLICLAAALVLGACRVPLGELPAPLVTLDAPEPAPSRIEASALGDGASPGDKDGPGGFVPRRSARSFYAGAGRRLWYYLNCYYWAPPGALRQDLWIKGEVVERFTDLRRWPHGETVRSPRPKTTVEYWAVGRRGRSVRLDNHKDYCLLAQRLTAGAIEVEVTLTLGHVEVEDDRGVWGHPSESYVLESRNYEGSDGEELGADRVRFHALRGEAVTVWAYRIPWSTHPSPMTRSRWQELRPPAWELRARRAASPTPTAVVTPGERGPGGS